MYKKTSKFKRSLPYILMALPATIYIIMFKYVPMFGNIIAFKNYNYRDGIFGSAWAGLKHFKFFFASQDAVRILRNTLLYNLASLFVIGLFFGMFMALLLYEVRSKKLNKIYQTTMLTPYFLSWVVISGVGLIFLNPSSGILNNVLEHFGMEGIAWYSEPQYWPVILMIFWIWKDAGMASLYFYSALLSIDTELFEAAAIDGAGRLRQIWYISLPCLKPMACITLINRMGLILSADLGLFYQMPMNSGPLYPTTDVIATYLQRGLQSGNISATAAVGLFQSLVGLVLVLVSNYVIKKFSPEHAMF